MIGEYEMTTDQNAFAADTETEKALMFFVPGRPRAKPSVRGRSFTVKMDKGLVAYREFVTRTAKAAADTVLQAGVDLTWLHEAVRVDLDFRFRPPHRAMDRIGRPHKIKPDRDNLEKLLYDAMQDAGVLMGGDQRVSSGEVLKTWALEAGVRVTIRPDVRGAVAGAGEPVGVSLLGG
jgi:Holliday junction resolvase RusA-like endonuclease